MAALEARAAFNFDSLVRALAPVRFVAAWLRGGVRRV